MGQIKHSIGRLVTGVRNARQGLLLVALAAVSTIVALSVGGCTTTTDGRIAMQIDPQRTARAIEAVVPPAVRLAVQNKPDSRKYIVDAKVAICGLADSGKVTPDDLKTAVESTGIKEIATPETEATVEAVFAIYQAYYSDVISQHLDQSAWLSPVLHAICNSIDEGLQPAQPSP